MTKTSLYSYLISNGVKLSVTSIVLFLLFVQPALAFCTWGFVPPEREYQPLDATEAFIAYENGVQTLVLQPEWKGDAKDFGIVYPTPSKPEIIDAPKDLFRQLNDATNPFIPVMAPAAIGMAEDKTTEIVEDTVTVVEEKQVGEYAVTVLTATDAEDLIEWLDENEYNFTTDDAEKVAYYVNEGGYYFVALKVDASHFEDVPLPRPLPVEPDGGAATEDEPTILLQPAQDVALSILPPDWFFGQLSPIQISFTTDKPQLPMRTLKSDIRKMTFDLYTLSERALYVPGVDTVWSNVVDADFLKKVPALSDYNSRGKWLVRQEVTFDPSQSNADLFIQNADSDTFTTVTAGTQVRFDPSELDRATGIIPGQRGQVVYTDGSGNAYAFVRSLTIGSVGEDVRALQKILNDEGFTVSEIGAGAPGNETTYFGGRTKAALIRYQNFYRSDILEPVGLISGTGYFGPSTIAFINR